MTIFKRILAWISDLRVAIVLLLLIAIASALGTAIPQGEPSQKYFQLYEVHPFLGFLHGPLLLRLELNHVYTSSWFLALLAWLGLSLMVCSWRRQWPSLQAAFRWIDYSKPRQLSKLALAETVSIQQSSSSLKQLANYLTIRGWKVQQKPDRLAARKGIIGRIGPPLVHIGLVFLMLGAVWGALNGQRTEKFLAPGRSLDLLSPEGANQLTIKLKAFGIDRDPAGRPEQFRSQIELIEPNQTKNNDQQISVNHPLRFKGITIYQADWSLAAITLQIGQSPLLQLPLKAYPELGEQIWGIVLPTRPDGSDPVLLSLSSEAGPVQVFSPEGNLLNTLLPGGEEKIINDAPLRIVEVIPASGLLLKRDPGVPLVYLGFAITLIGGGLSMVATRQLWAVVDIKQSSLHIGGLCNRNLIGLAKELPILIKEVTTQ